jgi:hypothetical protein
LGHIQDICYNGKIFRIRQLHRFQLHMTIPRRLWSELKSNRKLMPLPYRLPSSSVTAMSRSIVDYTLVLGLCHEGCSRLHLSPLNIPLASVTQGTLGVFKATPTLTEKSTESVRLVTAHAPLGPPTSWPLAWVAP